MKFLILATILLSVLPCLSQVKDKKAPDRNCRIIFLERPKGAPEKAHLFDGVISHEIKFSTINLSPTIKIAGGDIVLGLTANPVLDAESFPSGAPTVKIPASITDCYLVVVNDPQNKIFPVRILLVDASDGNLKTGQTLWINFTDLNVAGKLGNETVKILAKSKAISKAPIRNSGWYLAHFLYQPEGSSKLHPVMKKSWWHDATSKYLGLIVDTGGKLPKIFTLRDRPAPKPRKENN